MLRDGFATPFFSCTLLPRGCSLSLLRGFKFALARRFFGCPMDLKFQIGNLKWAIVNSFRANPTAEARSRKSEAGGREIEDEDENDMDRARLEI